MAKLPSTTSAACREAWEQALAHLRAVDGEFAPIDAQHTAAFDAAETACPRDPEFFSRYDLGCYEDKERGREHNVRGARTAIIRERCCALGRMLTAKEGEEATAEAIRVVDRFEAWCIRRDEVHAQHDCDLWEKRFNALVDKRWKAQLAVIHAPAPDFDAVRVKLELLAAMMDGEQDQERVATILGDTQRLLAA